LAQGGRDVLVLEQASSFGTGVSSRSSEVIHAGLYYSKDSLKAKLCVRGREMLYNYCNERNIGHRRCGKLIVATSADQINQLHHIQQVATANGVLDTHLLTREQTQALEPHLSCTGALLSPSTGIVDSHSLMLSLLADIENAGGMLVVRSTVQRLAVQTGSTNPCIELTVNSVGKNVCFHTDTVVNAAGLGACALASSMAQLRAYIPRMYFSKGNYFALRGRSPFKHLIYPIPEPGGLGVHLTFDLAGQVRFGPDVQWEGTYDYNVDPARSDSFYGKVRRYWPDLPDNALQPGYAAIRPKISAQGQPDADFIIQDVRTHGIPGLINLFGIESPGLTSCLAIGEIVLERVNLV
jgi:L-2-hydroxyglutarate oxidase LhgO